MILLKLTKDANLASNHPQIPIFGKPTFTVTYNHRPPFQPQNFHPPNMLHHPIVSQATRRHCPPRTGKINVKKSGALRLLHPLLYDVPSERFFLSSLPLSGIHFHTYTRRHTRARAYTLGYREITRMLAIMKTSRRRASAIITGSQPYNLLKA